LTDQDLIITFVHPIHQLTYHLVLFPAPSHHVT